tara:strand:- start:1595 stop:1876 length:282 start_codon:yes stop_codon:yes gene_type:complete
MFEKLKDLFANLTVGVGCILIVVWALGSFFLMGKVMLVDIGGGLLGFMAMIFLFPISIFAIPIYSLFQGDLLPAIFIWSGLIILTIFNFLGND